jgi:ribosomal protein S12 methylthiotransferase accessory factor
MLQRPALKAHLRAGLVPGEGVILLAEEGSWTLQGALFERVVPLLDGSLTSDQLVAALAPAKPTDIYFVLEFLEKRGHLAEPAAGSDPAQAAYWAGLGLDPGAALAALRGKRVRLRTVGADPAPLRRALEEAGLAAGAADAELEVVATDDYLRQELLEAAQAAREAGIAWLPLRPQGQTCWIGPLFPARPGASAPCFGCLCHRLRRNQQVQEFLRRRNGWPEPPAAAVAALPAATGAACRLAAVEAAKCLAGAAHALEERLLSLDTRTWTTQAHRLVRYPACPLCGQPRQPRPGPLRLAACPAVATEGSGHRATAPEATLERYGHLVSPILGIVSRVEPTPDAAGAFQVCVGGSNGAFPLDSLDGFKVSLRHRSAGKGPSAVQARASALAESLERYATEYTGAEFSTVASLRELGGDAIHPNAVMGFSERQYRERDAWNARRSTFNTVPEPLDPDLPIPWSPVWSLTQGREKWLPTQLLYFPSASAAPGPRPPCCRACSNGNAAGNNLEEAVLQGFLELVERDATAVWWYNRLSRPGVDLAGSGLPYLAALAAHYDTLDRDLWALDLTHDLGIPVFAAVSCRRGTRGRILYGLGCSLDPAVALQRACAELNQFISGIGDLAETPLGDPETLSWLRSATLENQPHLAPDPRVPPRRLQDLGNAASGDLLADIGNCRARVEEQGLEMLVLDLTRSDARMPVAKVIVPGLRHFWARFAPGRLYDVPVRMGWLARSLEEGELNPIPVFI